MRLYHFSDNPQIGIFVPRPVLVPSTRVAGMEWLNGPLVWAIEEDMDFLYHFPRECPRIVIWADGGSSAADTVKWLGRYRAAAYIERSWWERCAAAVLYRYQFPPGPFESLNDAGMHVSRGSVMPVACTTVSNLPAGLTLRTVDLRIVDSLTPLRELWTTSLHTSGVRLRNAAGWN